MGIENWEFDPTQFEVTLGSEFEGERDEQIRHVMATV